MTFRAPLGATAGGDGYAAGFGKTRNVTGATIERVGQVDSGSGQEQTSQIRNSGAPDGPAAKSLTAAEARGKQIYLRGSSQSGKEIFAYIGEASLEVPGSS